MADPFPEEPYDYWSDILHGVSFGRDSVDEKYTGELASEGEIIKIDVYFTNGGRIRVRSSTSDLSVGELIFSGKYRYNEEKDQLIMTIQPEDDERNIFGGEKAVLTFSRVEENQADENSSPAPTT